MSSEAVLRSLESMASAETAENALTRAPAPSAQINIRENISDEELLETVGQGSRDALAVLFRRHGRAVLYVGRRILRDDNEAADVRQDVFVRIFEKSKLFNPTEGPAVSWIMKIAYHLAIDRRRYLANRQHYDAPVFDENQSHVGWAPPSTDSIDGRTILSRLREALSTDQRETLELHLFEGYSLREIAEKNGQSLSAVRHHYYRGLDRLRAHIFPRKRK